MTRLQVEEEKGIKPEVPTYQRNVADIVNDPQTHLYDTSKVY